ncbi:Imm50 family immunity protein [Streptomyces fildesensis]|uniref:Imm50 family immunity protein n=1 Tax=Streptomyces fildesensis TaxID=375757 RepID=A0ABW8C0R3_9ACTN
MSASDWPELLTDPGAVTDLFAAAPDLADCGLFYLHVDDRETGVVTLGFELDRLPDHPLPEWTEKGLNAFEMFLSFTGVSDLRIDGWTFAPKDVVALERDPDGGMRVRISGPGECVAFGARAAGLVKAKAYLASRGE